MITNTPPLKKIIQSTLKSRQLSELSSFSSALPTPAKENFLVRNTPKMD